MQQQGFCTGQGWCHINASMGAGRVKFKCTYKGGQVAIYI
jgi:hypothetical protein